MIFRPASPATGETIAIIELGGGYSASDFAAYCSQLGVPQANVEVVSVDGGTSNPGADQDADTEVMLDIEVAGTIAPGARTRRVLRTQHRSRFHRCGGDRRARHDLRALGYFDQLG